MHQPRPYGRFVGETELTPADAAAVDSLVRGLTNFKHVSELDSLKRVRDLPSGRQAIAVDMGGTLRVLVTERHESERFRFDGRAETNLPMLFSGVVTRNKVKEQEGVKIKLTRQARRRLSQYTGDNLPSEEVELQRFVIKYHRDFSYFEPDIMGIYTFTQYHKQRPTWYSSAMAQVMQVAGGYGRQRFDELPDDEIERARMVLPEDYMREIRVDVENMRLPGYTGFPDEEGQFRCDYKHEVCHAVSFDSSNAPWLLRINARGVYAMPLPLVPATTTAAFRRYVEDVADDELELLLDRFGGLPTGEAFPEGEAFEAWRRAGVIIKVCDAGGFYDHQALYQASGWSLNSKGTEGFNTCWSGGGEELKHAHAYKMRLSLGPAEGQGYMPMTWEFSDPQEARRVDEYLAGIYGKIGANQARELAIKYKIRRHTVSEIITLINASAPDVEYWDRLEMDPIASHSGSVNRVGSGPLYASWSDGRLKFPELRGRGCESFVMTDREYKGSAQRCDTIVFGCYVDDSLQVIKYFRDDREFYREEEGNFTNPMIVGQWEKTVTHGTTGLMGNFYTSSFDDRQESPERFTHTELVGTDLGYGNARYKTPGTLFRVGSVSRSRYYKHWMRSDTTEGFGLDVAACVPALHRDSILYAYEDWTTGTRWEEEVERKAMADPTSYQLWTHDSIFHWMGSTQSGNQGEPYPEKGVPVYVDTTLYNPGPYSGYADSGDWLGRGGAIMDITGIVGPYTYRESGNTQAGGVVIGGEAPVIETYEIRGREDGEKSGRVSLSLTLAGSKQISQQQPDGFYYGFSPVEAGGSLHYFYRDAVNVAIGTAEYSSVSEKDRYGRRQNWGYTRLADHESAHHFIGVINE